DSGRFVLARPLGRGGMNGGMAKEARAGFAPSALIQDQSTGSRTRVEQAFAEVLANVLRVERLSADSHFFDELGADSLVMAKFCARVRKRGDVPSVSMQDIYRHPTIRSLAAALAVVTPRPAQDRKSTRLNSSHDQISYAV